MVELVELTYGNYSGRRAVVEWVCGMSHVALVCSGGLGGDWTE